MKKGLISKLLLVCVLVLGLSISAVGCTVGNVSDSQAVLDAYERYAESETRLFNANYNFEIDFKDNVKRAINETQSHFRVIQNYNNIASLSTTMFKEWRNLLKSEKENISKSASSALYKKFVEYKNACRDLVGSVDELNRWDPTIMENNNVNDSAILKSHLENLKEEYGKVIQKSFAMTNQFITIYDSLIVQTDFVEDGDAALANGDIELLADHFVVEVLDVAFEIDGVKLNMYNPANKGIYSKYTDKVYSLISQKYNTIPSTNFDVEDYSDAKRESVKDAIRLYQINLKSYKQQKKQFLKIINDVDYADFLNKMAAAGYSDEAAYLNVYKETLAKQGDLALAKFMFAYNFINTDFQNICNSFKNVVNKVAVANR